MRGHGGPAHTAKYWVPEDGGRKMRRLKKAQRSTRPRRDGCQLGACRIVRYGDFSSPDAKRGTGGPTSK